MAGGRDIKAGRAFVEIGGDNAPLVKSLRAAEKHLKDFGAKVAKVGAAVAGVGAAVGGGILVAAKQFAAAGDTLDKMSGRTGASVEALSELTFAASQSGASIETVEKGLLKLSRTIAESEQGMATASEALERVGLSAEQLKGVSPDKQLELVADALSSIDDPSIKAAAAMELLGKSGTQLLPMMSGGAAGIAKLREEASALGLTWTTAESQSAAALGDAFDKVRDTAARLVQIIGSAVAPILTDLAEKAAKIVAVVGKWVKENRAIVVSAAAVASGLFAAGSAITAIGPAIMGIGSAFGLAASAMAIIAPIVMGLLSPLGLALSAVVALGGAIIYASEQGRDAIAWLGDYFIDLKGIVSDTLKGMSDAFAAGDLGLAVRVLMAGMEVAFRSGISGIYTAWSEVRLFLETTLANATASLRSIWVDFATWWWQNFPNLTADTAIIWAKLWAGMSNMHSKAVGKMTDVWADALEFFGVIDNAEAVKAENAKIVREEENQLAADMNAAIAAAESRRGMTPEQLAEDAASRKAQIASDAERDIDNATQRHMGRMKDAEDALQAARAELASAVGEASQAAKRELPLRASRGVSDDIVEAQKRGGAVAGTFTGSAIGQQFGSAENTIGRLRDAIEKASFEQVGVLRLMLRELEQDRRERLR